MTQIEDHNLIMFKYPPRTLIQGFPRPGLDHITSSFNWALPLPCFLHCAVFLTTHMHGNSPPLGTNTQSLKPLSSFGMCRKSLNQLGNDESDVNLNIYNSDWVLSHRFPTRKSSHACAGRKTQGWHHAVVLQLGFS